jgi:rhodanese-related sulfurtransferase
MPKSGTVFCEAALSRTFGLRTYHVCGGRFPADALDPVALGVLGQSGRVAMTHADASPGDLALLAARGQPFVVHLRDPRAAMLSILHHIGAYHADPALRPFLARIGVAFPAGFHEAPFADQLDAMIAHYLPAVVAWTQGWLAALECRCGACAARARHALRGAGCRQRGLPARAGRSSAPAGRGCRLH